MKTASDLTHRDAVALADAEQAMRSVNAARDEVAEALAEFDCADCGSNDPAGRAARAARALEAYNAALARAACTARALARVAFEP